jgi:hypothetical protein
VFVCQLLPTACSHTLTPLRHDASGNWSNITLVQASTGPTHQTKMLCLQVAPRDCTLYPPLQRAAECGHMVRVVRGIQSVLCGHQGGNVPRCKPHAGPQQPHTPNSLPTSRQGRSGANLGSRTQRHQRMMPTPVISCCSTASRMRCGCSVCKPWGTETRCPARQKVRRRECSVACDSHYKHRYPGSTPTTSTQQPRDHEPTTIVDWSSYSPPSLQ